MARKPSMRSFTATQLIVLIVFVLIALTVIGIIELKRRHAPPPGAPRPGVTGVAEAGYPHLLPGNPSGATENPANRDNYLMQKPYFALAYNNAKAIPNWVSWHLGREDLGEAPRVQFYPDPDLPAGFTRVTPRDYTGGGFDRGHMCPHSDRAATAEMSRATFVMSNIVPQSPTLNQQPWAQLEDYCRELVVQRGKELYIICGPWGRGGEGSNGPADTIGERARITVPASCWKVILVLDAAPGDDMARVGPGTRMIAVNMPNKMDLNKNWAGYRVPVRTIEKMTNYKFFGAVPDALMESLKAQADRERIPAPRTRRGGGEE